MAGDGLRERKKRATRLALSLAAVKLTVERGWEAVTIEEIAAEADVSDRTFRNYFSSKAEAIASRHLDRSLEIVDELRDRPTDEPLWDAVTHAVLSQYPREETEPDPARTQALMLVLAHPAVQGEILNAGAAAQAELARAIAERTGTDVDRDLYPNLVAAAVNAATGAAVFHCLKARQPTSMGSVLADALAQLALGLPVPRGLPIP
jgi:AcrR family transcriptional regulator